MRKRSVSLRHMDTLSPKPADEKRFTHSGEKVLPLLRTKSNNAANTIVSVAGKQKAKSKGVFAKLFQKSSKQKRTNLCYENPSGEVNRLFTLFPEFPRNMMICLIIRNDGNCYQVYRILIRNGWTPDGNMSNPFVNKANKHLTVPYFFGFNPPRLLIKAIFKDATVGSFITYYKYTEKSSISGNFVYVLCTKNSKGRLVEKTVDYFEVPESRYPKSCSGGVPISDTRQRDLSWIPVSRLT